MPGLFDQNYFQICGKGMLSASLKIQKPLPISRVLKKKLKEALNFEFSKDHSDEVSFGAFN